MKCSICGKEIEGYGNNPNPIRLGEDDTCCDDCDMRFVIPARIFFLNKSIEAIEFYSDKFNSMSYEELTEVFDN